MRQIIARLVQVREPRVGYLLHTYDAPQIADSALPGHFIHIRIADGPHPILRRPFSIFAADGTKIQVLFKIVGEGTRLLSSATVGDEIDIIGPLGNPFRIGVKPAVLIAGGIGCAPLIFLAKRLRRAGGNVSFLYGARTKLDLLLIDEISRIADKLEVATEDGSAGIKGLISELATSYYTSDYALYACGPEAMLHTLKKQLDARGLVAQFSLESRMACGVGACQGCAVKTTKGYRRVCVDGPVFLSDEIVSIKGSPDA